MIAAFIVALATYTVWWWSANRQGLPWFIDEAGYLTFAIDHAHAIKDTGLTAALSHRIDGPYGPLIPMLSGTAIAFVGHPYGIVVATMALSLGALVLATWFLGRLVAGPRWGVLAALVVGTCPIVLGLTGVFYFAVPSAALFTFALACLLKGGHGDRPVWTVAGGASLGLATLARTMMVGLAPALVLMAIWGACRQRDGRTRRLINLAVAGVAGGLIMAPWWIPNLGGVLDYLERPTASPRAARFNRGGPWHVVGMRDLRLLVSDLLLPTASLLGVLAVISVVIWWRRGRPGGTRSPAAFTLAGVLIGASGVMAVASEATGQWIALLPIMVVLALTGLSRVRRPGARRVLAGLFGAVAAFNLLQSSRTITSLSTPRFVTAGPLGGVALTDGRWLLEKQVPRSQLVDHVRLPPRFDAVEAFLEDVARGAAAQAAVAGEPAVVVVPASADRLLNPNVLALADRLVHRRPKLIVGGFRRPAELDPDTLRAAFADPASGQPNFVLTVHARNLERALPQIGFRAIERVELPDGRHATLWWRSRADLGSNRAGHDR